MDRDARRRSHGVSWRTGVAQSRAPHPARAVRHAHAAAAHGRGAGVAVRLRERTVRSALGATSPEACRDHGARRARRQLRARPRVGAAGSRRDRGRRLLRARSRELRHDRRVRCRRRLARAGVHPGRLLLGESPADGAQPAPAPTARRQRGRAAPAERRGDQEIPGRPVGESGAPVRGPLSRLAAVQGGLQSRVSRRRESAVSRNVLPLTDEIASRALRAESRVGGGAHAARSLVLRAPLLAAGARVPLDRMRRQSRPGQRHRRAPAG